MRRTRVSTEAGPIPAEAVDINDLVDFLFDLFDLLDLIIDVLRNLGDYLSGR